MLKIGATCYNQNSPAKKYPSFGAFERTVLGMVQDGPSFAKSAEIAKNANLKIFTVKVTNYSREIMEEHFALLKESKVFKQFMDFVTGKKFAVSVLEGEDAIAGAQKAVVKFREDHPDEKFFITTAKDTEDVGEQIQRFFPDKKL